ncbi:MAG: HAD-IA family hydrolase, partial [Chloroflexota bacterium]|nr:HAD-IA family hydrolase [Chloroflexota bacterium]
SLLDEITAYSILCCGIDFGVTTKSQMKFRHVAPTGELIQITAWVTKLTKRLAETKGMLALKDGTVIAELSSQFYVFRQARSAFLWNLDTIINNAIPIHLAAWQETLKHRKMAFTKENLMSLLDTRDDFILRKVSPDNLSEKDIMSIAEEKEAILRQKITGNVQFSPGIADLLSIIKKGNFKQALVSSSPQKTIDSITSNINVQDYFDCIVNSDGIDKSKPNPQIYLSAAKKLGADPKECIVIENSPLGVEAAKTAGMRCMAVADHHSQQELNHAGRVVNSPEEIDLISLIRYT